MTTIPARMQQRRRTGTQWAADNPILAIGEIGCVTGTPDAPAIKVGTGTHAWNTLPWVHAQPAFSIGAPQLDANGLTRVNTNRVPRIQMPDGITSSIFVGPIGLPTWWFKRGIVFGFDVVNDHSSGGNVRFRSVLQNNVVGQAIASAATPLDVTETLAAPAAGNLVTEIVNGGASTGELTAGAFGSLWTFEIQRIGGDALDTLGGPISVAEFVFLAAP